MIKVDTKYPEISLYLMVAGESVPSDFKLQPNKIAYFAFGNDVWKLQQSKYRTLLKHKSSLEEFSKKYLTEDQAEKLECFDKQYTYRMSSNLSDVRFEKKDLLYVMAYFREIFARYQTECGCMLLINMEKKLYKPFFVLQYNLSKGSVHYIQPSVNDENQLKDHRAKEAFNKNKDTQLAIHEEFRKLVSEGWELYGTIHSHCDFKAFHSAVDIADEENFEGLHITLGHVNAKFDLSYHFVFDGIDFKDFIPTKNIFGVDNISELADEVDSVELNQDHINLALYEKPKPVIQTYSASGHGDDIHDMAFWRNYHRHESYCWDPETNSFTDNKKAQNLLESVEQTEQRSDEPILDDEDEEDGNEFFDYLVRTNNILSFDELICIEDPETKGHIKFITLQQLNQISNAVAYVPVEEVIDEKKLRHAVIQRINKINKRR